MLIPVAIWPATAAATAHATAQVFLGLWRPSGGGPNALLLLEKLIVLMEKLISWYFGEHVTGIVDDLLGTDSSTALREADASPPIDNGAENEITVDNGFVEIAGILEFFL